MTQRRNLSVMIYQKRSEIAIFVISFLVFGGLLTLQMLILGDYVNYQVIPVVNRMAVIAIWGLASLAFTILTTRQIKQRYQEPIEQFSKATEKVANGDFSVYVSPKHIAPEMQDHLDKVFVDFNKMVEELGSIETLKTDFFSNVSHEIKTPLAVIQNCAEILQKEKLTFEQRKGYATDIVQSTHRLSALITNILKLNKLEKQTIRPVPYLRLRQSRQRFYFVSF